MIETLQLLVLPAAAGALLGTLVGVLPGIGPAGAMALLLPVTFTWEPTAALVMMSAVYFGAQYGSSTTAILLNLPGEASGVVTAEQGHQLARQGRAGAALLIAALSSLLAGALTLLLVWTATPWLAAASLRLGPGSIAVLVALAGLAVVLLGQGGPWRNVTMLALGGLLGLVGADFGGGTPRLTLGIPELRDGIGLIPIVVGLFGLGELFAALARTESAAVRPALGRFSMSGKEWQQGLMAALRGTSVGAAVGMLPGGTTVLAALGSQAVERRLSQVSTWEAGDLRGVAGPEAANNASAQTGLIPLIGLGIPANPAMAVLMGALLLHGLPPGMALFERHPDLFGVLMAGILLANLMLIVINLPLLPIWLQLLRIPTAVLLPVILMVSLLGVYAADRELLDVWLMLGLGALGFMLRRAGYSLAPAVFGAVLAPLFEDHLRRAWLLGF